MNLILLLYQALVFLKQKDCQTPNAVDHQEREDHLIVKEKIPTQCAKDCGPHNHVCEYGRARICGSQFLAHAVVHLQV